MTIEPYGSAARESAENMKRLEWLFHIFAFAVQCNALVPLLSRISGNFSDLGASNPANTLSMAVVLSVVSVLILRRHRALTQFASGMWPVLALVALALLSMTWSAYPDVTIRRAGSLATATLWAWYLVARYDLKDVVLLICQAAGLLALLSLAVGAASPGLGQAPDGWIGVFSTKNELGSIMALASVTYIYVLAARRPQFTNLLLFGAALVLSLGLLYLSQSRSAWVATMVGAMICIAIRMTYRRVGFGIIVWATILLLIVPALALVSGQLGMLAAMLGKDSTLTGRVELWMILPDYIAQAPWFGHGYAAFWVLDSVNVFQIWTTVGWEPPHAHNGWLDVMLGLGAAGLVLMGTQILMILANGIRSVVRGDKVESQYILIITFVILTSNITESAFFGPGSQWVLLVISSAGLAKINMKWRSENAVNAPRFAQGPRFVHDMHQRAPTPPSRIGWPSYTTRQPTER